MRKKIVITKLLQSVTDVYYKVRQVLQSLTEVYYEVCQILQSASVIKKHDSLLLQTVSGVIKCDDYFKVRRNTVTVNENVIFIDYASGIQLPDCSKLAMNRKKDNGLTICWHDVIVNFFWRWIFWLVKFSYWSKFHVNITTGSGVML